MMFKKAPLTGPFGALWAPNLDFWGALCFYAFCDFPASLHGTRRHTDLRIKSPPERKETLQYILPEIPHSPGPLTSPLRLA